MHVLYDLPTDRFCVFENHKTNNSKPTFRKQKGHEYVRYIPQNKLTINDVNAHLSSKQYEACIEITNKCNFSCPICISKAKQSGGSNLPLEKIINVIGNLPKSIVRLTITGGEPTLHKDIEDILNNATDNFEATILSTNGYYPEKLESLIKDRKRLIVAVSLHGPETIHDNFVRKRGAFQKAIESIKLLIENKIYTHIYSTATLYNYKFLPSLFESLSILPIAEHRINLVKNAGRIDEAYIGYNEVFNLVQKSKHQSKITIKKQGQPFIFISCHGNKEIRNA